MKVATKKKVAKKATKKVAETAKKKAVKQATKGGGLFITNGVCGTSLFRGRSVKVKGETFVSPLEDINGKPLETDIRFPLDSPIRVGWVGKTEQAAAGRAVRGWLGSRRTTPEVTIQSLSAALKGGKIQRVPSDKGTLYLPSGFKPESHKLPLIVAAEVPGGRFERYTAHDGRNKSFVGFPKITLGKKK